jgi:hypothetical protein
MQSMYPKDKMCTSLYQLCQNKYPQHSSYTKMLPSQNMSQPDKKSMKLFQSNLRNYLLHNSYKMKLLMQSTFR